VGVVTGVRGGDFNVFCESSSSSGIMRRFVTLSRHSDHSSVGWFRRTVEINADSCRSEKRY